MARIFKRTDRSEYYIDLTDARGTRRRLAGYPSKPLTVEFARRLEQFRDCRKAGMPPPPDARAWLDMQAPADIRRWADMELVEPSAATASQPLLEHMEAWLADMAAKKRSTGHIANSRNHLKDFFNDMKASHWHDLSKEKIRAALENRIAKSGASARTYNSRLVSIRTFVRWCIETDRAATDPTLGIKHRNEKADRRRVRRPLSPDGLRRVIAAANASDTVVGFMTGPERALLYLVAASTGWRWSELRRSRRMDYFLNDDPPLLAPPGWTQKSGRDDRIPLRADVAQAIRDYFAEHPANPDAPAFPMPRSVTGAAMLRHDLANTGDPADVAEAKRARGETPLEPIPYKDERGRVADFHSLRHALATMVSQAGIQVKLAQGILRHANPSLTLEVYTHAEDAERAAALEALPALLPPAQRDAAAPIGDTGINWHGANANPTEGINRRNALQNGVFCERESLLSDCHADSFIIRDDPPIDDIGRDWQRANANSPNTEVLQNNDFRERKGLLSDCHGIPYRFAGKGDGNRNGDRIAEPERNGLPTESGAAYGAESSGIHRNPSENRHPVKPDGGFLISAKKPCKTAHYRKSGFDEKRKSPVDSKPIVSSVCLPRICRAIFLRQTGTNAWSDIVAGGWPIVKPGVTPRPAAQTLDNRRESAIVGRVSPPTRNHRPREARRLTTG